MKLFMTLLWLLCSSSDGPKFVLLNDILYKIPESEIAAIKAKYEIQPKDITIFHFKEDSCPASVIEWLRIPSLDPHIHDPYSKYYAKTTLLFLCDGKFVDTDYIYLEDVQSMVHLDVDKAIEKYGCKGLNPIFILTLQVGKKVQSKPVGAGAVQVSYVSGASKFKSNTSDTLKQDKGDNGEFTIIGKTKGFKDGAMLYLKKAESGSLKDNLDSAVITNNSFIFKGTITKPCPYYIHTGYTGWVGQPPDSFHYISFFLNSSTIYFNDEIGNLKHPKLSGSQLQNDNNEFLIMNSANDDSRDSLNKARNGLSPSDTAGRRIIEKKLSQIYHTGVQLDKGFIKVHPNSLISIWLLDIYKTMWGRIETKNLFDSMNPEIQKTSYGKSVNDYIRSRDSADSEEHFTDIDLKNLNGESVKLSSSQGKYILLDFWSSYCSPCRKEHPFLLKLYKEYRDKGFEIYAVCLDEKKKDWERAVDDDKITWITVSDLKGARASKAAMIYDVTGIPKNFLIDPEGRIIGQDLHGDDLELTLKAIFKLAK
jgi:thiol-disulfide isomerase/thioredoxin